MSETKLALVVRVVPGPGVLHQITGVIAAHQGNITSVAILGSRAEDEERTFFEIALPQPNPEQVVSELIALPVVKGVEEVRSMEKIYGKRIIIMGGGAQVAQVAIGAISES